MQSNYKNLFFWLLAICLLLFIGYKFINWLRTPTRQVPTADMLTVTEGEWVKGAATASATLVEYSDFQCPACSAYYSTVKALLEDYPEDLRVVYRHFPLVSIHPNALPAALATEAAGMQGEFWEMHDMIFERQTEWSSEGGAKERFISYAEELGLDVAQFTTDMDSDTTREAVNADLTSGNSLGVRGTPTFFLNGRKLQNPTGLESFRALIEAEIR